MLTMSSVGIGIDGKMLKNNFSTSKYPRNISPFQCPQQPNFTQFRCPRQLLNEYILLAMTGPLEQLLGTPNGVKFGCRGHQN